MNSEEVLQIWVALAERESGDLQFPLQLLGSHSSVRVFAAVRTDGSPGVIVEMPAEHAPAGIGHYSSKKLELLNDFSGLPAGTTAVGLFLLDPRFSDLFSILVVEIVASTSRAGSVPGACQSAVAAINRWRAFLEKRKLPLSEEAVRGLIGELVLLGKLIDRIGSVEALRAWIGPLRSIRDFELADRTIEVKTSSPEEGAEIRISLPEQLDAYDQRPVFVFVAVLARSTEGIRLSGYVDRLRGSLAPAEADNMDEKLLSAGYIPELAALYSESYAVADEKYYAVVGAFPRIASCDVPAGVSQVKFNIALAALSPFEVDGLTILMPGIQEEGL